DDHVPVVLSRFGLGPGHRLLGLIERDGGPVGRLACRCRCWRLRARKASGENRGHGKDQGDELRIVHGSSLLALRVHRPVIGGPPRPGRAETWRRVYGFSIRSTSGHAAPRARRGDRSPALDFAGDGGENTRATFKEAEPSASQGAEGTGGR